MRANTAVVFAWVVFLAALLPGCSNGNAKSGAVHEVHSEGDRARLEIKGSPGTGFTGSCAVGGGEPTRICGEAPRSLSYDLRGRALECEVSSESSLRVDLTVGENTRSTQSISGGTLHLAYKDGSVHTSTSSRASSYSGSHANGTDNDSRGPVTKESRNVEGFEGVELRGVGNLFVEQTGRESLTVEAEKDVVPEITTRIVDGRLIIGSASGSAVHTTRPINFYLTVKSLNSLAVLGAANVEATGIETENLTVAIEGTGNVRMEGQAHEQSVEVSGTSNYLAGNLQSKAVKVVVAGASSAIVNARQKLYAEVSGAGSVEYVGDPRVQQTVSGAGRVSEHR